MVYSLAGGHPDQARVSLPAFAAAALAFFVVSNLLVEAVLVLTGGTPALGRVRQGVACGPGCRPGCWGWRRWSQRSPGPAWPGPDPGLPTAAVYLACRGAIKADREPARAEAEQAQASAAEQA
jgi:hypothetical protein